FRQPAHARDHLHEIADRPHLPDLLELLVEVIEGEARLEELLRLGFGLFLVDVLLRPLDQREDVPHPEDPCREPVGVEDFEPVEPLARAQVLDRHTGRGPHGQRRSAATVRTGTPRDFPGAWSCSAAAGRWTSAATRTGWRPWRRRTFASFATVVVLPEPCRPTSAMTVGGRSARASGTASRPSMSTR